jgi:hypothetical protein
MTPGARSRLRIRSATVRGSYISGILNTYAGRSDLAIERAEASLRLSPRGRFGTVFNVIGCAHFLSRRFDEAVPKLLVAIQDNPNFTAPFRYPAASRRSSQPMSPAIRG